jgi:hypothetical protein
MYVNMLITVVHVAACFEIMNFLSTFRTHPRVIYGLNSTSLLPLKLGLSVAANSLLNLIATVMVNPWEISS